MEFRTLVELAAQKEASDIHLSVNAPPAFRIDGELFTEGAVLSAADTKDIAMNLMTNEQWQVLSETGEVDFSYRSPDLRRFRVNVYQQRGCVSIAARMVPNVIPTLEELELPEVVRKFAANSHGLVLVTGPTGNGKSTTLAAMVDAINRTRRCHVITLEDPIEYLHPHHLAIIDQREISQDTRSFAQALRAALRQDPDVILIGEMRDLETMTTALSAAETGHLVLATLHTADAVQSIDRIIDVFPPGQQTQIRVQLSEVLQGVISQRLVKTASGRRKATLEVLVNTPAVANLIRTSKTHQIRSLMQTGRSVGMQTMEMGAKHL